MDAMTERPIPDAARCMVGPEGHRCGFGAVGAIALGVVPTVYNAYQEPTRGAVLLCERHFNAAPSDWDKPTKPDVAPPRVNQCPDCGKTGSYDGRAHIDGRGVYRCANGHMWQDADETPGDKGYTGLTTN